METSNTGAHRSAYRPAYEVVRLCALQVPPAEAQARLAELLRSTEVSWRTVLYQAKYHALWPSVETHLQALGDQVPAPVRRRFATAARHTQSHNRFILNELRRLVGRFEEAGLRVLVLKGPVLACLAYGGLPNRPFTDMDLYIDAADFEAAEQLLLGEGYGYFSKLLDMGGLRKRFYLWRTQQYQFRRGQNVFNIDLHTALMPPFYYIRDGFDAHWARSVTSDLDGHPIRHLELEDQVLNLCYHGEKNRWERLKNVRDVAGLLASHSETVAWDTLFRRAEATHGERILALGLRLAHELLDLDLPADVRQVVYRETHLEPLVRGIRQHLAEKLVIMSFSERMRFHLTLQNTAATKMRYAALSAIRHFD